MLLLSSTLLFTYPTSTTLFPVLSKLTVSVLSFEDLTDNSNVLTITTIISFLTIWVPVHVIEHSVVIYSCTKQAPQIYTCVSNAPLTTVSCKSDNKQKIVRLKGEKDIDMPILHPTMAKHVGPNAQPRSTTRST
jgi:hypothetical protein